MKENLRIDLSKKENLKHWCSELKCTEEDLVYAIFRIGNRVQSVNDFLIVNRKIKTG